eukprot:evm.model.scf_1224.1 EVM.evm.TU.scf_1224.1   scf_1224:2097-4514(+)
MTEKFQVTIVCGAPSKESGFNESVEDLGNVPGLEIRVPEETNHNLHSQQAHLIPSAGQALSAEQTQQLHAVVKERELSVSKWQVAETSNAQCVFEVGVSQSTRSTETRAWIRRVLHPHGEIYQWNADMNPSIEQMMEEAKDVALGTQLQAMRNVLPYLKQNYWKVFSWKLNDFSILVYETCMASNNSAREVATMLHGCANHLHRVVSEHMPRVTAVTSPALRWINGVRSMASAILRNHRIKSVLDYVRWCLAPATFGANGRAFKLRLDDSMAWAIRTECIGDCHTYIQQMLCKYPLLTRLALVYRTKINSSPVEEPDMFLEVANLDRKTEGLLQGHVCDPEFHERFVVEVERIPICGKAEDSERWSSMFQKTPPGKVDFADLPSLLDCIFSDERFTIHAPSFFVSLSGGASWIRKEIGLTESDDGLEKQVREKKRWAKAQRANVYIVAKGVRIVYNPISCNSILLQANHGQTELQFRETGDWVDLTGLVMAISENDELQQMDSLACRPEQQDELEEKEIGDMDGLAIQQSNVSLQGGNGQVAEMLGIPSEEFSTEQHEKASLWFKGTYLVFTGQTWLVRKNPRWKRIWNAVRKCVKGVRITNISAFGYAIEWSYVNVSESRVGKLFWGKELKKRRGWMELQSSTDFAEMVKWTNEANAASFQLDWRYVQGIGELLMSKILPIAFYPYGPCCCWRLLYNNKEMQKERNQYERFDYEASTAHPVPTNSLLKYVDGNKVYIKKKHVKASPWALLQPGMEIGDRYIQLVDAMDTEWEMQMDPSRITSQRSTTMEYIGGCQQSVGNSTCS